MVLYNYSKVYTFVSILNSLNEHSVEYADNYDAHMCEQQSQNRASQDAFDFFYANTKEYVYTNNEYVYVIQYTLSNIHYNSRYDNYGEYVLSSTTKNYKKTKF